MSNKCFLILLNFTRYLFSVNTIFLLMRNIRNECSEAATGAFCKKMCSWKFHKIHRKTPVPETFFNKLTVYYTFSKFYVMICYDIFHISCTIALISSMVHGYSVLVFTQKLFSKCKCTHYNVGSSIILNDSLNFRNNSRTAVSSPSNLL